MFNIINELPDFIFVSLLLVIPLLFLWSWLAFTKRGKEWMRRN
ncbi:hypothetical protein Barb4_01344 [Bacteroidales bacterium Barb4]|nr:hypothetical protein Barb4_01344 [Bacteroidales bacterium Barb4]